MTSSQFLQVANRLNLSLNTQSSSNTDTEIISLRFILILCSRIVLHVYTLVKVIVVNNSNRQLSNLNLPLTSVLSTKRRMQIMQHSSWLLVNDLRSNRKNEFQNVSQGHEGHIANAVQSTSSGGEYLMMAPFTMSFRTSCHHICSVWARTCLWVLVRAC